MKNVKNSFDFFVDISINLLFYSIEVGKIISQCYIELDIGENVVTRTDRFERLSVIKNLMEGFTPQINPFGHHHRITPLNLPNRLAKSSTLVT